MYPVLPKGFVFGASTASYQIEGAVTADGRGPSVWDTFSAEPGRIIDGSTGAEACDHYHRYAEDVALMERLGLGGYRFSIAWPRIQPTGRGPANVAGLDFYDRLVDALLAADVAPMATLFHWDLPQALQDRGGWTERETVDRFEEYAAMVAGRLADRVAHWCPVNEPNVVTMLGHALGIHAPGKADLFGALPVAHHLLLGHGRAVRVLRDAGATSIGTANNHTPVWVAGDTEEDRAGAEFYDAIWNRMFADPILLGAYPEGYAELLPVEDGDLEIIATPIDFYGLNYYNPTLVGGPGRAAESSSTMVDPALFEGLPFSIVDVEDVPRTDFGWPVVPDALREELVTLKQRYPNLPPVHITENGCSYVMGPDADGVVDDQPRIDYLDSHLRAVARAVDDGVDVRGYWTWSLLDNWEWAEGFTQRFGLVYVDYATQRRTPKRSFEWYADTIRANG
jgi:beta-glucosidase